MFCLAFCLAVHLIAFTPARADQHEGAEVEQPAKPEQPFAAGVAAYDRGEFELARRIWLPWAHRGDPAAQRNLAHIYRMGLGVAQDFVQAAAWYRLAADSGLARAQANLATMYLRGQGVEEDASQAAYWFTAAAAHGHPLAQYNLALLYLRGEGVERSEAKAAGWLYRAAKAGHKPALKALGKLVAVVSGPAGPPAPPPAKPAARKPSIPAANEANAGGKQPDSDTIPPVAVAAAMGPLKSSDTPPNATTKDKKASVATGQFADKNSVDGKGGDTEEESSFLDTLASLISYSFDFGDESDWKPEDDTSRKAKVPAGIAAGLVALHAANFDAAKQRWEPLARNGNAEAQYQLGKLYLHKGFSGASKPYGFFWLSRAAAQQHTVAKASKEALDQDMSPRERAAAEVLFQEVDRKKR